jgi:hypothetical protein
MKIFRSGIFVALCLALVGVASAQVTTGTLIGRLQDSQGLALPGVTVTATGPQGAKSAVSDADGTYRVPFLTPGTYDVKAELQGFKTVEQKGATVSLGQTTTVNLELEVGGLTEVVQVTGTTAVVDTTSTTTGAVMSAELLQRVPVGRRFTDALYLAPGVSNSGAAGTANPSMSGSTGLDNLYVVDGVNITNTGYGAVGSYSIVFGSLGTGTPFDFVQEVQVKTGGYEAEFGQSMGGVVNVVTKSGTNDLRGSVFGYFQPAELEAGYKIFESPNGTVNTVGQGRTDTGIEGGFPIVRNKLFFFGAINPAWEKRTFTAPEGFPLRSLGEVDRDRMITSYSAKATYQASSSHRFDASFFGDPAKGDMGPQRTSAMTVTDTSSFSEIEYGGHNQTVRYDGVISPTWLVEANFSRAYNNIAETPSVDAWRVTDTTVVPQVITGGIGFYEKGNEGTNLQYGVKTTYVRGGHQIKGGFMYEDVEYANTNQRTGPTFTAPDGRQTATGAQVNIIPDPAFRQIYRVIRANFIDARVTTQNYWSFFAQDTWRVGERLTINPGVRYEQQTLVGNFAGLQTLQGNTVPDFALKNNWAPRIGAIYDVLGNGRSKLYGNYGRFFARIPNDLAARALSGDEGVTRIDYFDANLTQPIPNGVLAGGQTNHFVLAGVGGDIIDEDAKLSYKDEFVAGFEYEAFPNINLGVRYIYRNIGRVLEDVANAPVVAYDLGIVDTVEYILTNPKEGFPVQFPELGASFEDPQHTYNALEFTADRRFSNNWSLLGSYRWSRLHGTFEGFFREDNGQSDPGITSLYDFPTNDPSYTAIGSTFDPPYQGDIRYLGALGAGPLPLDRPHQFKVAGNRLWNNGLSTGTVLQMGSGKPLTALEGLSAYGNTGEVPLTPRGEGFETTTDGFQKRTPFEFQVDLQASYALNVGNDRLTLLADVFNLFNLRRTIDYNSNVDFPSFGVPNPDFGTPTSANVAGQQFQRPFQLRLGVRYAF